MLKNDSMVNAVLSPGDGSLLITGDSKGLIKLWDLRKSLASISG